MRKLKFCWGFFKGFLESIKTFLPSFSNLNLLIEIFFIWRDMWWFFEKNYYFDYICLISFIFRCWAAHGDEELFWNHFRHFGIKQLKKCFLYLRRKIIFFSDFKHDVFLDHFHSLRAWTVCLHHCMPKTDLLYTMQGQSVWGRWNYAFGHSLSDSHKVQLTKMS